MTDALKQSILEEAHRLGFILAGVTIPDPPPHFPFFEDWLVRGHHADMAHQLVIGTGEIGLSEVIAFCPSVLEGRVRGRTVVDVNR